MVEPRIKRLRKTSYKNSDVSDLVFRLQHPRGHLGVEQICPQGQEPEREMHQLQLLLGVKQADILLLLALDGVADGVHLRHQSYAVVLSGRGDGIVGI
jgi:hypothetical protein